MQQYNDVPSNLRLGGGAQASSVHPIVMVIALIAVVLIFLLPRKRVIVPLMLAVFLTPFGEQFYIAGVHLFLSRILILVGWLHVWTRMTSKEQGVSGELNPIDKAFLAWAIISASSTILLFLNMPAIINQAGFILDAVGGYFLLRRLIQDEEDVLLVVKTFAVIVSVLAVTMSVERLFGRNLFGYLGGRMVPTVRDGVIRSQGTLAGPIPAGTFAATLFCLFAWLWKSGKAKVLACAGGIGSAVMVVTSASSTPLLASMASVLAICMWPLRGKMRALRWGIVIVLTCIHLVMKAPVWFLINRVDLVAGSSGYHRAILIDQCVRHFSDWWLIGIKSTANWGWDLWDQANQFVGVAENAGLAALIFFILMISRSFGRIGTARRHAVDRDRKKEWFLWLLGGALFSHVVGFFGISYMDQTTMSWYLLLVFISAATAPTLDTSVSPEEDVNLRNAVSPIGYASPLIFESARNRSTN
jgi:hypothetical protein